MARPKVIIADEDANYIVPLQFKFVTDFFNKIDLEIITDRAYFDDYFSKPQNAEILIVSEELYDSFLQRHNIQNIFVMMEQYDEGGTGELNVNQIFKYTSIKEIFNEIIGKSAGALNVAAVEKKETQIILVTSAAGGVGKTTVAMGVAACLVQNYKRVLYIEAASLQSAQYMLENDTPISSPDIYTKLLNPSDSIYADIKHVIRKEVFSYIPPFKAAIMSVGLSKNIYMDIAVSAKKSGEYDYIVVDTDSVFDEFKADLLNVADKVIFVTKQNRMSVMAVNTLMSNINGVNIELSTEYGKDTFVSIVQANNKIELIEKASKYGTYVNGKRISKKAVLKDFDFISVADFSAYYKDKQLYFSKRNIRLNGISQIVEQVDIGGVYPMFIRNTRAKSVIEDEKIKILDPDTIPTKPELNIVTSLMPTIVMFALVVVLRGIMSESGGTYVIFSICSMGMGVITSVLNIVHGQNKYKKDCEKRRNVYLNYVAKKKEEIIAARNSELEILRDTYYSTEENLEHIESFSAELFDRTPEDEDFLDIYLGVGKREAERKIEYKEQEKLDTGDDLCQIPTQLSEEYKYIDNAPIYIKAKDANAIGIIGRKERQNEFIKCLLIDIISRQYFGDVNVYAFIDDNVQEYDWLKLIPHIQPNPNFRNIVCDTESKNIVFEYLYKELTYRSEHKGVPGHNVIFILNDNGIKSHPISRFIEHASELNTTFIFFETEKKYLPLYCSQIVVLEENYSAYTYASENKTDKTEFKYACVSSDKVQRAIDILAPVYCEEISLESSLRKNISLFELLGIYSANDLELKTRWNDSKIYETMAVPLGINVKNDVVCLNLHEKFHGPHGLVAGTTGSGKSEILQSFILSAATYFHPYEIGFVIIDFKGGGMVNQFKDLPHLIGAITNIDGNEIQRSLKSIKAELMKRQNHFASAGVNHIDKYIQLYKDLTEIRNMKESRIFKNM